jgi:uncharacterized protein YeaO (DUF488 family)
MTPNPDCALTPFRATIGGDGRGIVKQHRVLIARVYDAVPEDGRTRILVDRIWPRGLSKLKAQLTEWDKTVAPSTELRTWYGHDPDKFTEFRARYRDELAQPASRGAVDRLRALAAGGRLTLLTATKDVGHSHAVVLAELLEQSDEGGSPACMLARVCLECGRLADEDPPTTCRNCGSPLAG